MRMGEIFAQNCNLHTNDGNAYVRASLICIRTGLQRYISCEVKWDKYHQSRTVCYRKSDDAGYDWWIPIFFETPRAYSIFIKKRPLSVSFKRGTVEMKEETQKTIINTLLLLFNQTSWALRSYIILNELAIKAWRGDIFILVLNTR